ncbi:MAG TPA: 4-hydroxythreonine-4-phosphate dehydrogenase [candidate division Zixibacteria bacterium]|nr:4-hydroxythreonine-4-phosphate dehydrogenase [candidate division Zixibacteria bacterium]
MAEFIFMLTRNDQTVPNALQVYDEVRDTDLRCVGFKDVGASIETLRELTRRMHADGRIVYLEVVSERAEDELRSLRAACDIGVDVVMGGTHAAEAREILDGSGLRYYPFPGNIIGHPSLLRGTIQEISDSAASLTSNDFVHGVDLLAYRYDGDIPGLIRAVRAATGKPIVAAGSIDSVERIRLVSRLGVDAFTIGGAVFDAKLPAGPSVREQVEAALQAASEVATA